MTRLPHNYEVDESELKLIDNAETYIRSLGVETVRVRVASGHARIEVGPDERTAFFDTNRMDETARALKDMGFLSVALDMEGYKTK
jgi:uncharacterized protein